MAVVLIQPHLQAWNVRYQIVSNVPHIVGGVPPFVNQHHRKRVKQVHALLLDLVARYTVPDTEFVVNLHGTYSYYDFSCNFHVSLRKRDKFWTCYCVITV